VGEPEWPRAEGPTAGTDERIARYEAEYDARVRHVSELRGELRRTRRVFASSVAQLAAILAALLVVLALVGWLLVSVVGPGALAFAVPALAGFLVVGYWEHRKQQREG
jgi:Flp pilus assembly protein TadB